VLVAPASSEAQATLPETVDLHARPAADFVRAALALDADVVVAANGREADAKSLMSVLALGAKGGSTLTLRAEGEEASGAVQALADCIAGLVE
jgi:phosphocarrier protein HPr